MKKQELVSRRREPRTERTRRPYDSFNLYHSRAETDERFRKVINKHP